MEIAILLFDGLTALDAVGPYEVLQRVPGARLSMVAREPRAYRTDTGSLALLADAALSDVPAPDIVCVPGGFGVDAVLADEAVLAWIRGAHERSRFTTSVCTGSLLLGAAGLLRGLRATTHWLSLPRLADFGAVPSEERVVEQGRIVTAAGVSSGIDMALRLAQRIAGDVVAQAIQLSIEYDPEPPFDAGSPRRAPPAVVSLVREAVAERRRARP